MSARACIRIATLVASGVMACASAGSSGDGLPRLEQLQPDSARVSHGAVVMVRVIGSGFDATDNTVWIGSTALRGVSASDDGRRITFAVPDAMDSRGEAAPSAIVAGRYPVQVETAVGRSNVLQFTVLP
ncbi:MAG: hypothetical protein ABJA80_02085 [bacterium]